MYPKTQQHSISSQYKEPCDTLVYSCHLIPSEAGALPTATHELAQTTKQFLTKVALGQKETKAREACKSIVEYNRSREDLFLKQVYANTTRSQPLRTSH